jgi:ribonucleoside-diphosphate reductase alpha chain
MTDLAQLDRQSASSYPAEETSPSPSIATSPETKLETKLLVIKRNGNAVPFDPSKISHAMTKAFIAVEGQQSSGSAKLKAIVDEISEDIAGRLHRRLPEGGSINIEDIQDLVELGLMRQGHQKIARAYVLYREEHSRQREQTEVIPQKETIAVKLSGSEDVQLDLASIDRVVRWACSDISDVNGEALIESCRKALFDGMKMEDVATAMIMTARPLIETEPGYSQVCARLLLDSLWREVNKAAGLSELPEHYSEAQYPTVFINCVRRAVDYELLSPTLLEFDLERLGSALKPERDRLFNYLGLQTLYDRYFLHKDNARLELPQTFFMRVAMGLALNEDDREARAIEFYEVLSKFDYMTSTPTLFNSGTLHSQLSSCYLTTVPDDLGGIYGALHDNALLSKWAGGLGNDWTPVRGLGAHIKGTNGQSQGVVPFLKVVNDTAVAVNQGGKRKGAVCAYLESWHLDIEEFLELRKNTGDERRRTHDMNSANWLPDLFLKRVFNEEEWTLFSPNDVPDLHDLYGRVFEERFCHYEQLAKAGEIKLFKTIPAIQLWRRMLSMLFETGHPWITFKDPCNVRSPQQHKGVVHSSNLCTEITLNTSDEEIAVCNLGSINLANHIRNGELDQQQLQGSIETAVRMLDNVVDINFYAVEKARVSNMRHRPVGLGIMGFQDALYAMNIPYGSEDAVHFADQTMELVSYHAISASARLAQERGRYPSYEGSLWDQGVFPIDSLKKLEEQRGSEFCTFDYSSQLDWEPVRELVRESGMRNSNVMAIAPTATISNIVGVSQSIEPTFQNLFVKSNLSGEFTVINPALVQKLKERDLWDEVMVSDLKYFDGSLQPIDRIPADIKALFATAFDLDSRWLVEAAARRQKWIDQAQSLNLYMAEPSGKQLDNLYKLAWSRGLKTTYYLRSRGATHADKPLDDRKAQDQVVEEPKFCSILDPDCEACQ